MLEEIKHVLNKLKTKKGVVSLKKTAPVKQFIALLLRNQRVKILENTKVLKIQSREDVFEYSALPTISAKKQKLLRLSTELLPCLTGHLIVQTRKGLLTHQEAISENMGGQVIGLVF